MKSGEAPKSTRLQERIEINLVLVQCLLSCFSCVRLFVTPWTLAHQAPLSMEFSRQEYWSGLPHPSPGDLPHTGIEPGSPAMQADSLLSEPPGKPLAIKRLQIFMKCSQERQMWLSFGQSGKYFWVTNIQFHMFCLLLAIFNYQFHKILKVNFFISHPK